MILGVDISTSITGFAVVTDNVLVYYDSIDLRKHKGFFAKTIAIKEKLMDIYEMYQLNNDDKLTLAVAKKLSDSRKCRSLFETKSG